jgi:hypothetical protein
MCHAATRLTIDVFLTRLALGYSYGHVSRRVRSQSRTAQRVLFVVDTDRGGASLYTRTVYVGPTRGREDIRVYTNDKERMVRPQS